VSSAPRLGGPIRLVSRARDIKLEQFTQSVELDTERGDIEMTPANCRWRRSKAARLGARSNCCCGEGRLPPGGDGGAGRRRSTISARRSRSIPKAQCDPEGQGGRRANIRLTANRGWISVRRKAPCQPRCCPTRPATGAPPPMRRRPQPPKDLSDSESRCDLVVQAPVRSKSVGPRLAVLLPRKRGTAEIRVA